MDEIKDTILEQLQQLQMLMHRTMFGQYGRTRSPHRGQGRVLAILKLKPEISQRELTYLLNMSKQAVGELIAKLEKSGYLTREPSEEDKRVMTIKLTEEGAKAADKVDDDPLDTAAFDCLSEEELAAFSDYLGRIIKQYEEQFPGEDFEQRRRSMEDFMAFHGGHRGHHGHGGHHRHGGHHGRCGHHERGGYPERDGYPERSAYPDRGDYPERGGYGWPGEGREDFRQPGDDRPSEESTDRDEE